jgi:hypothetical protein
MIVLHGPAGLERMALDGKLGSTLRCLVALKAGRQSVSPVQAADERLAGACVAAPADRLNVACLIQSGLTLLLLDGCTAEAASPTPPPTLLENFERSPFHPQGCPCDGHLTCRRVRDGPLSA